MDEEWFRNIAAQNMAHAALLEFLLVTMLANLPARHREGIVGDIKRAIGNTDYLTGATKGDEFASERLADLVVRTQEHANALLTSALTRVQATKRG